MTALMQNFDPFQTTNIVSILHFLVVLAPNIQSHPTLIHLAATFNYINNNKYFILMCCSDAPIPILVFFWYQPSFGGIGLVSVKL